MTQTAQNKYYTTDDVHEKVILVGIALNRIEETQSSLDELGDLAATAGATVLGRLIQNREAPHPGTYLGKGKDRGAFHND